MRVGRSGSKRRKLLPHNECEGGSAYPSHISCEGGGGERKNPSLIFIARKGGWLVVTPLCLMLCKGGGRGGGERRKPLPCICCKGGWVVGGAFRVRDGWVS